MTTNYNYHDAVVIGGGFYGTVIAIYLARQRHVGRVLLIEQEAKLLTRASYTNQARIHNGYHYPRSFTTAYRSRINAPKFVRDWPDAVKRDFTKVYAIARRNSKVTALQFRRFCHEIGARIRPANSAIRSLFEPHLIEDVFLVDEWAFDTDRLASWAERELKDSNIEVRLGTLATAISCKPHNALQVTLRRKGETDECTSSRYVFNCTYSGLNQLGGDFPGTRARLKQEVTEMALLHAPAPLNGLGITVMDGPFFSMMPFPARGLHTLSHVRYTPHFSWADEHGLNPYQELARYDHSTRINRMIRDAGRYLPALFDAKYVDSLFEIKTLLVKNEGDDGRPILFEKHATLPGCYSVLGGKIDNIYDVLERLDTEDLASSLL